MLIKKHCTEWFIYSVEANFQTVLSDLFNSYCTGYDKITKEMQYNWKWQETEQFYLTNVDVNKQHVVSSSCGGIYD